MQDEEIDREGLPFDDAHFANGIPAEVDEVAALALPDSDYPVARISRFHVRSYELGDTIKAIAVWQDRFGNWYSSLSYKGSNFSAPGIIRSATAPARAADADSGFIPHGLQESSALLRIVKSSRILRENKIPTEWIVALTEPSVLSYDGELVGQEEYRKRLLEKVLGSWAFSEAAEVAEVITPMTFFVTARCMEINDRPADFLDDDTPELVRQRLHKIFKVYNLTHSEDPEFRELDADKDADCRYYFAELLPVLQGRNLARLHNIGLIHKFPVPGNVTALGGIVDLDSIHGVPLGIGDNVITFKDIVQDAAMVFENNDRSYLSLLKHLRKVTDWLPTNINESYYQMQRNFWDSYHQNSTRTFSDTERCLMFLNINRTEPDSDLAEDALQFIRELLTEREPLLTSIGDEFASLMIHYRERREEQREDYERLAIDETKEIGNMLFGHPDAEADSTRLAEIAQEFIEADATGDCVEALIEGGASDAFDQLVNILGITEDEHLDLRSMLARVLFGSISSMQYLALAE